MKSFLEQFTTASPKKQQKIADALAANGTDIYFNAFMQQAYWPNVHDYTTCRLIVTQDFVANYHIALNHLQILPISSINNIYKSSILNGKYNFGRMGLVAETVNGLVTLQYTAMEGKADVQLDPIVNDIRASIYQHHQSM